MNAILLFNLAGFAISVVCGDDGSCLTKSCNNKMAAPLLDDQNAPLVVMIDLSKADEHIKEYVNTALETKMANLVKTKLEDVFKPLQIEEDVKLYVDEVRQNVTLNITDDIKRIIEEVLERKQMNPAFFSTLKTTQNLGRNDVLIFPNVVTNNENGYDVNTGIFNSPKTGVYEFSANFISNGDMWLEINLMKNGHVIARAHCAKTHGVAGTLQVILTLQKGDTIYLQHPRDSGSIDGSDYSMFSGHML
ncbi:complement C1q tumor necrosis factor-related protein 3-like [Mytilus edulis]|uniref:complement C1q tumor necrosis factor-related protein 3-like n=1 Tax=Mytilus edulis TaxID=6550 RepID=UPI0039EE927C